MSEALVPVVARREIARPGAAAVALPEVIVDVGPAAVERFLEFFAAAIANDRTCAAYGRAAGRFLAWCATRGLGLRATAPLHVAAYIRTHPGSAPTVKQHLAAIRALCDWLVVHQVLPVNPAASVRGPRHVVTKSATSVLTPAARVPGRAGDDQAAGGGGFARVEVLPPVSGDGHRGVSVERGDTRARATDRRPPVAEDDQALRPDAGHDLARRDRTL